MRLSVTRTLAFAVLLVVIAVWPSPGEAQGRGEDGETLRREIDALQRADAAIRKELQEIKALLRQMLQLGRRAQGATPTMPDEPIGLAGFPVKGSDTAKLVLIDFTDYQ